MKTGDLEYALFTKKDVGITRKIRTENGGNKREDHNLYTSPWEVDLIQFLNNLVCGRDIVVPVAHPD